MILQDNEWFKWKYLLSIFVVLSSGHIIHAQVELQSYMDIGENNVSEGLFLKNAYRSSYQYQMFNIEAGIQFDLISNHPNTLSGLDITGSRAFFIQNFSFDMKSFFMLNRFSDLLYETNWGITIETRKLEHFLFEIGTNFKTYTINSAAIETYTINESNRKLRENFNLIYLITAYLKPHTNEWNVGISCTNIDYYMINQSTNPVFNLQMTYHLNSNLTLFVNTWYKQAGIFNINANYFGYFFRGGIKWEI